MNELRIGDILRDSIDTYKAKWKTLIMLSLISTLISVSISFLRVIVKSYEVSRSQSLSLLLMTLIITIVSLYFTSRFYVSMIIVSSGSLTDEAITVSHSYEKAKYTTWRYIGNTILFSLMLLIPLMMIVIGLLYGKILYISFPISALLVLVGASLFLYLNTTYYSVLYAAVLHPKVTRVFTFSKQLVKGSFIKVMLLTLILAIFVIPINILEYLLDIDALSLGLQLLYTLLISIPSMLYVPLVIIIAVVTMKKLESLKAEVRIE